MPVRRSCSRLQQLIGDSGQRADYHHRLRAQPALHDTNEAANGVGVLYRRAPELHHHHIVASAQICFVAVVRS